MYKLTNLDAKKVIFFALSFISVSSMAFSLTGNRFQRFVTENDAQQPDSNRPEIPNTMMPPKNQVAGSLQGDKDLSSMTIVEIISKDTSFSNLNKALKAAGLMDTLSGPGPFTLFAPNDQAFAKLSPNALDDLLSPTNKDKLLAILNYHVVPGKITPDRIKNMKIRSLQGKQLDIKVQGDKQTVNNAKIVRNGAEAANGEIYVIDTLLTP
jgi:uncharacterized surface protein with fasciclin (FAS1) repeats